MSQQSNPATLREALSELRCVADNLYMNLKGAANFNPEGFNTPALEQVFQRFKMAAAKSVEIETALAASGTEAAPCPECESRKRVHDLFERKWNKDAPETVSVDEIMAAKEGPAQAAASPEGEGRDAWEVAPGTEGDNWGIRRVGEDSGMSIAQMLWERDARHIVEIHNTVLRQSAAPSGGADYHRGAKEAFQRVVDEWPTRRKKVQSWANNCAVYEQQHRLAKESKTGAVTDARSQGEVGLGHGGAPPDGAGSSPAASIPESGETGAVTETK